MVLGDPALVLILGFMEHSYTLGYTNFNSLQGSRIPTFTPLDLAALAVKSQISQISDQDLYNEIIEILRSIQIRVQDFIIESILR